MKALTRYPSILHATVCLFTTAAVFAAPDSKNARQVRFLAVGESPPYRQEVRNGVSVESPPPPDSVPPREVTVGAGGSEAKPVMLGLGRISNAAMVSGTLENLVLRPGGANEDAAPWLSLKCPASGDLLVCLYRNPAGKNWKDVLSVILPDGPKESPAGSVRIVNLYSLPAQVDWAGEVIEVPAGGTVLRTVKPDAGVPVHVDASDASGKKRRYFSGEITQKADERGLIAIHGADQPNPRRPVKVLVIRERGGPPSP